jgi:hypothetical protein
VANTLYPAKNILKNKIKIQKNVKKLQKYTIFCYFCKRRKGSHESAYNRNMENMTTKVSFVRNLPRTKNEKLGEDDLWSTDGGCAQRCVSDDNIFHIGRSGQVQDVSEDLKHMDIVFKVFKHKTLH